MRKIFLLILLVPCFFYAQRGPLMHEVHYIPAGDKYQLFYSFKVPYNRLVFEKTGSSFLSEYELMIEISDSTGAVIRRHIEEKKVDAASFEETGSELKFSEGLLSLYVPAVRIRINAVFTDKKNGREIHLPERELVPGGGTDRPFISPFIVYKDQKACGDSAKYRLANFEGNIPFTEEPLLVIIPAIDTTITSIHASVIKDDSVYWKGDVDAKAPGKIILTGCSTVALKFDAGNSNTGCFIIDSLTTALPEGVYSLQITDSKNRKESFDITVSWYNRPLSLSDPEYALEALRFIEDEKTVSSLEDVKSSEYRKVITRYWQKKDPTPGTMFNPLMEEYYRRIDYASKTFASLKQDGVETDRGMVFIKYGKPVKVERSYNSNGQALETWLYEKNKFIFVDTKGTGEFLLIQG